MGIIVGVINITIGVTSVVFHNKLGDATGGWGQSLCEKPLYEFCLFEKFYHNKVFTGFTFLGE
ncbi:MAG: hypothetical protein ACYTFY_15200 [Planctomycetota bacterium]|jgi:hypothetical protein